MKRIYQQLRRNQIDQRLKAEKGPPPGGWIRSIREALCMSTVQLARRLGVKQPAVVQWEKGERAGTITMGTLRKIADALECDLAYAFEPRKPLEKIMEDQARLRATSMVDEVSHSMDLEGQKTSARRREASIREEMDLLLRESPGKIWNDWPWSRP